MKPYSNLIFEVTPRCNAICYYCPTGRANLFHEPSNQTPLTPEFLHKTLTYMLNEGIINKNTIVDLFNKGEPFLHPNLSDIFDVMNSLGLHYTLSSNGSVRASFNDTTLLKNLDRIIFSMPGFSDECYKAAHGFSFEKTKQNIVRLLTELRRCGFVGEALLVFHIYIYNFEQLKDAEAFANEHGMILHDYLAYVVDYRVFKDFLSGKIDLNTKERISKDLFLHDEKQLNKILNSSPSNYWCEHERVLMLDENANVVVCCVVNQFVEHALLGSIFDYSLKDLIELKKKPKACIECKQYKMDYFYSVINKYRASDINRLYGEKILSYWPYSKSLSRKIERLIVRAYLFAISKWGYFGYYANNLIDLKRVYRSLVQKNRK
ncbi:radical SAM protein [Lawsonia intracellularis]|uniref:NA n=1 Tax=Lawsonia intracellularis (strain PHE/MN1-00) TaxID=363253 RepID=Q1MP19_LAWIP|nr:radical SAM protein [Lawsonia intracellularis]AGC50634.1 hypothetical protein LAW_10015 [Lawsonia intracellularis N343]KAA0204226.1 radical SAM protein [Lawsonia intracellularis]MBZ3893352.1 radical SAM protein [Lawsonia intracellularis]OMQ02034.1 radical SAM protein [Lawsonia intracellularis]RBN31841.1 radical SAM protein [Lawsonia intracellularis]